MALTVRCENCQLEQRVGYSFLGKRVRCRSCGHMLTVTQSESAPPDANSKMCPRCGAWEATESRNCFQCGHVFQTHVEVKETVEPRRRRTGVAEIKKPINWYLVSAGVVLVLLWVIRYISQLFTTVQTLFDL